MPDLTTEPKGAAIEIKRAHLDAVKADLKKNEVKLTFSLRLDQELLDMRERLSFLAWNDDNVVSVTIQPLQDRLL